MAHAKFPAEVVTPEGEVFSEEIEMLSARTALGTIGILAWIDRVDPSQAKY